MSKVMSAVAESYCRSDACPFARGVGGARLPAARTTPSRPGAAVPKEESLGTQSLRLCFAEMPDLQRWAVAIPCGVENGEAQSATRQNQT